MSASLNAVPGFNYASVRDTSGVGSRGANNLRSNGNRDSFSQVFRRTSDEQRSSRANSNRESDKKDKKAAKKDSDTNADAQVIADSTAPSEKSSLPITFLLGLPSEQLEGFDTQHANDSSASALDVSRLPQGWLFGQTAEDAGDISVLTTQATALANAESYQKSDAAAANAKNPDLLAIGETGNSIKGAAGALSPNTLAFAMRLGSGQALSASKVDNSAQPASPIADALQTSFTAAAHNAIQAASGSALEEHGHEHGESDQGQNIVDLSASRTAEPFDTTKLAEENATPAAAQLPADPSAATGNEPVKNLHMQLVSDDNRRVDVRLMDRGGELHVSVKSADPELTQNLQDHLPDLTARLEKQHMQTEVWVPKAAEPTKAESGNTNGFLSDPRSQSYSSNPEREKDGRQQRKPDWVDALENYS